ncbi:MULTISPECIES: amino acid ABC transporter permease [Chelativorans]|jgi:polar amino acid transport system permease protein|uniref:Amino acid ABC transporter membrane protein 2, PAAT family n=1 Tax=Chelativorans sp. (strain BNC1) TaxID=266779 RepID=Q11AM2_CHESB|nr:MULTISPECIES: amino acid ABC transporter permease [Chelativorans]
MLDVVQQYWPYLLFGSYPNGPLGGFTMTLVIAIVSLVLTFPSAVLVALARTSEVRVLEHAAFLFVTIVRGIPLLMLIFWVYFFLPVALGTPISPFWSLILAIVVFQTAYLSEVLRAAIEALPKGQTEAALSLGLSYFPRIWKVTLPQALYNSIPGILNQFTSMIKETSLGYVLAVEELTYAANKVNNFILVKPFSVFALLALTYFAVCFTLTQLVRLLEARIENRFTRVAAA